MITRRNLLSTAGASGALAMAGQVAPALTTEKPAGLSTASYSGVNAEFIKRRQKALLKDQNLFMDYPDNQNMMPEGYYKWRDTMFELDFGRRTSNTVGDPYYGRNPGVRGHYLECDIIDRFGCKISSRCALKYRIICRN